MGPQSYDCGNAVLDDVSGVFALGFNGAAVVRLRKWRRLAAEPARARASMGPQSYDCGNRQDQPERSKVHVASMGPQSYDCGNERVVNEENPQLPASMGPQSYDCGNSSLAYASYWLRLASMGPQSYDCGNMLDRTGMKAGDSWLQWGRSRTTAEIRREAVVDREPDAASMGPQSYDCGNVPVPARYAVRGSCFNGAAVVRLRKYEPPDRTATPAT